MMMPPLEPILLGTALYACASIIFARAAKKRGHSAALFLGACAIIGLMLDVVLERIGINAGVVAGFLLVAPAALYIVATRRVNQNPETPSC